MMSVIPQPIHRDPNADTILTLAEHAGALAIADSCRETAMAFIHDSQRWGAAELAMWLMGPYAMAAHYAPTYQRRRSGAQRPVPPMLREIDPRMVGRIIATARTQVLETLAGVTNGRQAQVFARGMVDAGFVARCLDFRGASGWVPTTDATRLADRVLSLLAAYYLARSDAHEYTLPSWDVGARAVTEHPVSGPSSSRRRARESGIIALGNVPSFPAPESA